MDMVQILLSQVQKEVFREKSCGEVQVKLLNDVGEDHYGSQLLFVEATSIDSQGKVHKLDVVVKYAHILDEAMREKIPIGRAFQTEILIYDKVVPRFHKLQQEKSCPLFKSTPQCYFTQLSNPTETVVLENLKSQGYLVHNKTDPMNLDHLQLVLETYAEWHALSFALKDQHPQDYHQLTKNIKEPPMKYFILTAFGQLIDQTLNYLYVTLQNKGELKLLRKYKSILGGLNGSTILVNIMNEYEHTSVITHGDCRFNNFLFKYEDTEHQPTKVAMIDFQHSTTMSPAIDLSYFLYTTTAESELKHLKELLLFYHQKLNENLRKLGSDPSNIFLLQTFRDHWKKYAIYGTVVAPTILLFNFLDDNTQIDMTDEDKVKITLPLIMAKEDYYERVLGVVKSFVEIDF